MKMPKEGKKPPQNHLCEDFDTAIEMAAIIAAELAATVKETSDSDAAVQQYMKLLKSDRKMAGAYIAMNIPKLDVERSYKVGQFLKLVEKYFKAISETQLSRALNDVAKQFRFEHLDRKFDIKKQSKGKIKLQFDGRPSAYMLPSKVASIKRVYESKVLVTRILSSLKDSGVLRMFLEHRIIPMLRTIQEESEGRISGLVSAWIPTLNINQEEWDGLRNTLLAFNDEQLEKDKEKLIELLQNMYLLVPELGRSVLILGFSRLGDEH